MDKKYLFYALSASNAPEDFRYIGVTSSTIKKRLYQHTYCALHKRELPVHKWMYHHIQAGDTILYTQIGESTKEDWESTERRFIEQYNKGGRLLNISKGGSGIVTSEMRSVSSKQRGAEGHYKSITLIDAYGTIVDTLDSCSAAATKYNLSKTAIGNVLSGRSNTAGGYYIVSSDKLLLPTFNSVSFVDESNNKSKVKLVFEFSYDGKLKSIFKSKRDIGFDKNSINRAIVNRWNYKDSFWALERTINVRDFKIREN